MKIYDPFSEGGHRYLGAIDAEIGFAGRNKTDAPLDQDELGRHFTRVRFPHVLDQNSSDYPRITRINSLLQVNGSSWITKVSLFS